jgi:hypothetical protein
MIIAINITGAKYLHFFYKYMIHNGVVGECGEDTGAA